VKSRAAGQSKKNTRSSRKMTLISASVDCILR
jgi:hypothetical protein